MKQSEMKPISRVRRARAELRAQGVTASELAMLEEIALQMRDARIRTLRGSYLAQCLGVSRQWANAVLRRLEAVELVTRFKTGLVRLNLEKLSEISETALKRVRRKVSNAWKTLRKSARGNSDFPNKEVSLKEGRNVPEFAPISRLDAMKELRETYVPLHLRKARAAQ